MKTTRTFQSIGSILASRPMANAIADARASFTSWATTVLIRIIVLLGIGALTYFFGPGVGLIALSLIFFLF